MMECKDKFLEMVTDACRYRWLRQGMSETLFVEHDNDEKQSYLRGAELDAIIDKETDAYFKEKGVNVDRTFV